MGLFETIKENAQTLFATFGFMVITFMYLAALPYYIVYKNPHFFLLDLGDTRYVGLASMVLGTWAILRCYWDFATVGKGTPAHWDPPQKLVVIGLYRYVRNPIYVGAFVLILGEALYFEADVLLLYLLFIILGTFLRVLLFEERGLKKRFGESYEQYRKAVPRWIPRLTPYQAEE